MLPISEKGKDIPREKDLDSGRSKDEGTSYRNHTHDPSRRYYCHHFFSSIHLLLFLFPFSPFWVGGWGREVLYQTVIANFSFNSAASGDEASPDGRDDANQVCDFKKLSLASSC